ncbi:MAG TPA: hypothetical protein VGP79_00870 [Bryobacteraceae bacterium]|jgi:hypothetical protein|nr:hypothetical protein [Bryobacteraceae bacterium]
MTEVQMFTIALSTVPTMVVVLVGILISNVRLGDVRDLMRAEMKVVEASVKAVEASIEKNHSEMLHRFAELDTRLSRIENGLGMRGSS